MRREKERKPSPEMRDAAKTPEPAERPAELVELTREAGELVSERVEQAAAETLVQFQERERVIEEMKREFGVDRVEKMKELEERTGPLRLRFQTLRRIFRKVTPFLLPVAFAASLSRAEHEPKETASFDRRAVAAGQLEKEGITDERRSAYTPGVSEFLHRAITPIGYQSVWELAKAVPENLVSGREGREITVVQHDPSDPEYTVETQVNPGKETESEDAWKLYLGLPQEHGTFGISDFRPARSQEDRYYYKINGWLERFAEANKLKEPVKDIVGTIEAVKRVSELEARRRELSRDSARLNSLDTLLAYCKEAKERGESEDTAQNRYYADLKEAQGRLNEVESQIEKLKAAGVKLSAAEDAPGAASINAIDWGAKGKDFGVMGQFTLSVGEDELGSYISYYDKWNLGGSPVEGEQGFLGKPYEIYDRIYYDPATYKVINPVTVTAPLSGGRVATGIYLPRAEKDI